MSFPDPETQERLASEQDRIAATLLPGEGEQRTQTRTRIACFECAELATRRHTFILHGGRANPASSAYGKDDISWCSDCDVFTCDACEPDRPAGYSMPGVFYLTDRRTGNLNKHIAHMFMEWR